MFYKIPVGAVVWINDVLVKCVQDDNTDLEGCRKCVFTDDQCREMYCNGPARPDGVSVHFERVELEQHNNNTSRK